METSPTRVNVGLPLISQPWPDLDDLKLIFVLSLPFSITCVFVGLKTAVSVTYSLYYAEACKLKE